MARTATWHFRNHRRSAFKLVRVLSRSCDSSIVRGMLFIRNLQRPSCQAALACFSAQGMRVGGLVPAGYSAKGERYAVAELGGPRVCGSALSGKAQALWRRDSAARKGSFRDDCRSGLQQGWNEGNEAQTLAQALPGQGRRSLPAVLDKGQTLWSVLPYVQCAVKASYLFVTCSRLQKVVPSTGINSARIIEKQFKEKFDTKNSPVCEKLLWKKNDHLVE